MKLKQILKDIEILNIIGGTNIEIEKLCCDTKDVCENCLFFCLNGGEFDGHNFAETAKQNGAVAIVCERPLNVDVTQIVVKNSRSTMSFMASNFYGNPKNKLKIIGITGTNGKTTTSYYIASILKEAGFKVGVIGTIGVVVDGVKFSATLTTPDPIKLHEIFSKMVLSGVEYVVMEVSAHAIKLEKLLGIKFEVGVLTNITQDHLDYFKTFDEYKKTKQSFFNFKHCKNFVVNVDDDAGKELVLKNQPNTFSYGLLNPCDVFAFDYKFSLCGTNYNLNLFDEMMNVKTTQIGKFNLYNALASATVCKLLKIKTKTILKGLEKLESVLGRFNVINLGNQKIAVVDYAHTPDGLKNILLAVREVTNKKIISVFGCGGNRDSLKRPIMGQISAKLSDFTIITSDNPRFENPGEIIKQIEEGAKQYTQNYLCIENRSEAIYCALKMLDEGDCVVVSGKGAEDYLEINGVKYAYSDYIAIENENKKIKEQEIL